MLRNLRLLVAAAVTSLVLLAACGGGESVPSSAPLSAPALQRLSAPAQLTAAGLNAFFAWAATAYPQYFSGATQDGTISVDGYGTFSYRHFASGNYLAVLDDSVYVFGPVSGNSILRVGALNDFTCNVYPGNLGCSSIAPMQALSGNLASMNDQENRTTYLHAGVPYSFTATSTDFDTYLSLYSPGGNFLTAGHDSGPGLNTAVWHTPSSSGLYTVHVNSAAGGGIYVLKAFFQSSAREDAAYIAWPGSGGGNVVFDATNGDNFAFDAASRCLYSWNRNEIMTNFCLDPGSSAGTFAGQQVKVMLVRFGSGCAAALADPSGFKIDIDTSGLIPRVTPSDIAWTRGACG